MPKKKFIDKKNATTFVIGHRSQRDPLLTDETAPQNILIPLDQVPDISKGGVSAASAAEPRGADGSKVTNPDKRKEEQRKYGIYFDDDYDYLQHLKDSNEVSTIKWDTVERIYAPSFQQEESHKESENAAVQIKDLQDVKVKLPSSVFESKHQEEVGLLNKLAPSFGPRPDLDPDILAALDEKFEGPVFVGYDHDDASSNASQDGVEDVEDNFNQLLSKDANVEEITDREPTAEELEGLFSDSDDDNEGEEESLDSNYEDEEDDSLGSLNGDQYTFKSEETKTQFTNYSMSSSVVKRNKQLLLVDDRFEKFFEAYEDTEIGALDCEEIEGDINPESDLLMKYAEEFEKEKQKEEEVNQKIAALAVADECSDTDSSLSDDEDEAPKEKWDCQSIISTYSTTKNRPKVIREPSKKNVIRVSGKTGIPVGVLGKGGLTKDNLKILDHEYDEEHGESRQNTKSILSGATSIRLKNETPEERRARKLLVRDYRKERRAEKKANSTAFKEEKKRLVKVRLNSKANVQGLKF